MRLGYAVLRRVMEAIFEKSMPLTSPFLLLRPCEQLEKFG